MDSCISYSVPAFHSFLCVNQLFDSRNLLLYLANQLNNSYVCVCCQMIVIFSNDRAKRGCIDEAKFKIMVKGSRLKCLLNGYLIPNRTIAKMKSSRMVNS